MRTIPITLAVLALTASPASATPRLTFKQAKEASRTETYYLWSGMDARKADVSPCSRKSAERIDCHVKIRGAQQTCKLRTIVVRRSNVYLVHIRDIVCR